MAYTRRQELICTEDQMNAKPNVILRDGEVIRIRMNNGSVYEKIGDGVTPIIDLPYNINSEIKTETLAELERRVGELGVVQTTGDSPTAVMSQKATTELAEKITEHTVEVYASATPEKFSYEGYISPTTGVANLSGAWLSTDYIPVSENTIINSNSILGYATVSNVAYYDSEKNFISCIAYNSANAQSENKYTITNAATPTNAKYVRITLTKGTDRVDQIIVEEWTKALTKEDAKQIVNEHIPKIASRNLMTLTFENAIRHDSHGQFVSLQTGVGHASSPDYIEVIPNETYTLSWKKCDGTVSMYLHMYDENKALIKTVSQNPSFYTSLVVTIHEDCHYISLWLVDWNNAQVPWRDVIPENLQMERGYRATPYVRPDVIDNNYIDVETLPLNRFNPTSYGLPVVEFVGNIEGMDKDNAVTLNYTYGERSGTCTLKWQGTSSLSLPKKNYTVKFDTAFEAKEGWGVHNKYCLKADWVDFSHCRNVVSAKLWGDIVRTRATSDLTTRLSALPNGGAIDGFPCFIVINGEWQGIYNFNIPKEDYLFGMGSGAKEAIVCAENTENCLFKGEITLGVDLDLEYASDSFTETEIQTSLNRLINSVKNSDGTDIDTTIAQYVDIDSAIDYMIFVQLIHHWDGVMKNYLLATYDGTKWFFSAYDMDLVYGNNMPENNVTTFDAATDGSYDQLHTLFKLLWEHHYERVKARYNELVNGVMAKPNLTAKFTNYMLPIPKTAFIAEAEKWKTIPSTSIDHIGQIVNWYGERIEWCAKRYF